MSPGHCVITWLGPGAGGGASGHPAIRIQLQRLHRCMVWCGRVWYFVKQYGLYYWWAEKSKIFNYSLYYCIFNCVNCRDLTTQPEADLPLELTFKTHELRLYWNPCKTLHCQTYIYRTNTCWEDDSWRYKRCNPALIENKTEKPSESQTVGTFEWQQCNKDGKLWCNRPTPLLSEAPRHRHQCLGQFPFFLFYSSHLGLIGKCNLTLIYNI